MSSVIDKPQDIDTLMARAMPIPDEPSPDSTQTETTPINRDQAFSDVGTHTDAILAGPDISGKGLHSDRQVILQDIYKNIGGRQVSVGELSFAPSWILEEAFNQEMVENWTGAYELIDEKSAPRSANKIGCHAVYKVKNRSCGTGELVVRARNVLHGNLDRERYSLRRDSESEDLDVKGAYMQIGPAKGEIFVRTPQRITVAR